PEHRGIQRASVKRGFVILLLTILLRLTAAAEQVVISEIMYNPPPGLPEFVEIYNNTATPFDIANWKLRGKILFEFPSFNAAQSNLTFLRPFERIVVTGKKPAALRTAYGIPDYVRVFGPWSGKLPNDRERVTLEDKNGVTVCS